MKTMISKCFVILLFLTTGYGFSTYAQCVAEEDVYTFTFDGHTYDVIRSKKEWAEAASCAVERGGYLVEINSQAEQDTIYEAIVSGAEVPVDYTVVSDGGGIAYVWIGASDQHSEGNWLWDGNGDNLGINFWNGQGSAGEGDGASVDGLYHNWGGSSAGDPNEPDDFGAGQDGAAIGLAKWPSIEGITYGLASEWNDISSTNSLYFIVESDCMETRSAQIISACDSYVSPSGNTLTSSGNYLDTIENSAGCDSIITTELTIVTVDTSVSRNENTLSANAPDAMCQWLDCNNGYARIEGETDQSLTPAVMGSFAVEITVSGCTDTSSCHTLDPAVGLAGKFRGPVTAWQGKGSDLVHVALGDEYRDIRVQVIDISGRMVHREAVSRAREFEFKLAQPPGIYFIHVRTGDLRSCIKLGLQ